MTWRVRVRPEAELDLLIAAGWYEAQRRRLSADFLADLERLLASLAENALLYAGQFDDVRRAFARRFPLRRLGRSLADGQDIPVTSAD